MLLRNVLGARSRLTQSSLLQAVSEVVGELSQGSTDQDMAEAWGVSKSTVENARNRKHVIASLSLLGLIDRFGPEAVDPILALVGCKAVPIADDEDEEARFLSVAKLKAHAFVGEVMEYETSPCHTRRAKLKATVGALMRALGAYKRRAGA